MNQICKNVKILRVFVAQLFSGVRYPICWSLSLLKYQSTDTQYRPAL